jgi:hypothetical protein
MHLPFLTRLTCVSYYRTKESASIVPRALGVAARGGGGVRPRGRHHARGAPNWRGPRGARAAPGPRARRAHAARDQGRAPGRRRACLRLRAAWPALKRAQDEPARSPASSRACAAPARHVRATDVTPGAGASGACTAFLRTQARRPLLKHYLRHEQMPCEFAECDVALQDSLRLFLVPLHAPPPAGLGVVIVPRRAPGATRALRAGHRPGFGKSEHGYAPPARRARRYARGRAGNWAQRRECVGCDARARAADAGRDRERPERGRAAVRHVRRAARRAAAHDARRGPLADRRAARARTTRTGGDRARTRLQVKRDETRTTLAGSDLIGRVKFWSRRRE